MNSSDILHLASEAISNLTEKVIDVVDIKKPDSLTYALT